MRGFYSREHARLSWVRWIGVLCVALVMLAGIIQVAHTHADGRADHEGCTLCNTAHQVVQTVALVTVAVSIQPVWRIAAEKPLQRPRQRLFHKHAIRPPPVSLLTA
jgi:hypothetical protein